MSKLTELLDGLDVAKLLPDLESLLNKMVPIAVAAVMIGPLILLALGLLYFFAPPKEANHKAGFRTYFGMGSVQAWRFTQRIAGMGLGGLGAILTVVMFFVCLGFGGVEPPVLLERAIACLLWEIGATAVVYLAIVILVTVTYDKNGYRRR